VQSVESAEVWLGTEDAEPYLLDVVRDGEEQVDPGLHLGFDGCAVQLVETFLRGTERGEE